MKILGYFCARMGSGRLPGKMLKDINGIKAIDHTYNRFRKSKRLSKIVVATSSSKKDDLLCAYLKERNIPFFRGSEADVLSRTKMLIEDENPDICVQIFGDAIFNDYRIVDEFIDIFIKSNYEFVSNDLKTTYPPGLDVEVFNPSALIKACELEDSPEIREHGTLAIRVRPDKFKIKNFVAPLGLHRPDYHLSLDTIEDLICFKEIYKSLGNDCSAMEIIEYLDSNPKIKNINVNVERRFNEFRNESLQQLQKNKN
jgi:spore coat polysaccharide biosynthesis protein SpsF (cytidylyltransferase family)